MKAEVAQKMLQLQQDASERRVRLAGNLGELRVRMQPRNLAMEAKEASLAEFDRVTDELLDVATDLLEDSVDWMSRHRGVAVGGAVVGVIAAAGLWYGRSRSRRPVPIYAAYNAGDHGLMADPMEQPTAHQRAAAAEAGRLKDRVDELGERAGRVYDSVRARARVVAADARARAEDVADAARERTAGAGDAARAALDRARAAADEAADWARAKPRAWPGASVLAGLVAGAILGAVAPAGCKSAAPDAD